MTAISAARSDIEIPELSQLGDSKAMLPLLAAAVEPELLSGWRLTDVGVVSLRNRTYDHSGKRSKSSVLATYRLRLSDRQGQRTDEVDLYLRAFLDPMRAQRYVAAASAAVSVPGLHAGAWLLGGDPALPALGRLTDERQVIELLPPQLGRVLGASVTPLRYKPEDRCTLRVRVRRAGQPPLPVVAKIVSSPALAARLERISTALWSRDQEPNAKFTVPQLLGHRPAEATLWLSWLPGRSPRRRDLDPEALARIARALASLHASPPIDYGDDRPEHELDETLRKLQVLARFQVGDRFDGLGSRLAELHALLGDGDRRLVHGAFRLRQLLCDERGRVGMVDFDGVALGDPTGDVADFLLDLDPTAGKDGENTSVIAFVDAYQAETGQLIDRDRLRWQLATRLIKRAYWLRTAAAHRPAAAAELVRRVRLAEHLTGDALTRPGRG